MPDRAYDDGFAELARELRFASVQDIEAGRGLQEELARSGRQLTLGEALVQLGAVSIAQHEAVDRRVRLQPPGPGAAARRGKSEAVPVPYRRHRVPPRRAVPGLTAYAILGTALAAALALVFVFAFPSRSRRGRPTATAPGPETARNDPSPSESAPPVPASAPTDALERIREGTARRILGDLKRLERDGGLSPGTLRLRYDGFVESYGDTEAGREAVARMKSLPATAAKVQPAPAPSSPPPSVPPPPPKDGLLGHWKLDRDPGRRAKDSSGQGHGGELRGNPQWTSGRVGGALAFDGEGDYVDTGFKTDLAQWTVACWVRSPRAPASRLPNGPVHREKNFQISWDHRNARARGTAGVCVRDQWHLASFGPLRADRWVHLAATYDGEALRAYTDGALVTENAEPSGPADAEIFTLKIGAHAFGTGCFRGKVDEVRLYDYALSAGEIRRLAEGD